MKQTNLTVPKNLLESTRFPLYKMLNVTTAFRRSESPLDISDFSELAAIDMVFHYLEQVLDVVHESLQNLQQAQIDDTSIRDFQQGLHLARARIQDKRMSTFKQVDQVLAMIERTQLIEKMIAARLGSFAESGL